MPGPKASQPAIRGTLTLADALDQSQSLAQLLQRLQQSQARFADIREQLPPSLRNQVRPGPIDDAGWSLLAPSGAVASKLRQLLPELQAALIARGWPETPIRIRVNAS
jgi:hypothetical protein